MKVGDLVKEKFGGFWRTGIIISENRGYIKVFFSDGTSAGGLRSAYCLMGEA